jgi:hypothetical protein
MVQIITLAGRNHTQRRLPEPHGKPVMTWMIDPTTGRPVMSWSLPLPVAEKLAA